ncbi:MAG: hypothetical protein IT479_11695 [Xanthomonadales bacterium]|nr:hypothetical protein [Xanthomonadales bacterium]MCC6593925.1 hypothetical protein [Xanthomonadales bacterium]MCE7932062.1 hypothetical protein [Xanthomonadales bacterium PRO6]
MAAFVGVLLLAPLLAVLLGIYHYAATRAARTPAQRRHDRWVAAIASVLTVLAAVLAFHTAPSARGPIWPQVYAVLGGFFAMLLALGLGWRRR